MNILYITTIGSTMSFFKPFIEKLVELGHTVDIAANEQLTPVPDFYNDLGCRQFHLDCSRSPFSVGNIACIKQIRQLVEENQYDIVHCHTPIVAACTRIACKNTRKERTNTNHPLRVFYTAHGFHFYKGAPKKNWAIYYPVEKLCARWTDILFTINKDDYKLAQDRFAGQGKTNALNGCRVVYVPGMGVDVNKLNETQVNRSTKREELGVPEDAFLMLSVGELNSNKNHQVVIQALAALYNEDAEKYSKLFYVIAGEGPLKESLQKLIDKLGLCSRVKLLGFRKDCPELYKTADVNVFPSIREGLGLAALEGMSVGLPLICSNNRGSHDYAIDGENAIVCNNVIQEYCNAISVLYSNESLRETMGLKASKEAYKFSLDQSINAHLNIYGGCYDS